jgi:hypothetical protein
VRRPRLKKFDVPEVKAFLGHVADSGSMTVTSYFIYRLVESALRRDSFVEFAEPQNVAGLLGFDTRLKLPRAGHRGPRDADDAAERSDWNELETVEASSPCSQGRGLDFLF